MTKAKLIVLNGYAASGKTTIAKKYIDEHSMALALEADLLVGNIGDWYNHREKVRQLSFEMTKAILRIHLQSGHDVILPYLVTSGAEVEEFELIASECDADYYEFVLHNERSDAITRLLKRGKWGEENSPPVTEEDRPHIEKNYAQFEAALQQRPQAVKINLKDQNPEATYAELLRFLSTPAMASK